MIEAHGKPCVAVVGSWQHGGMTESVVRGFRHASCRAEVVPFLDWAPHIYDERVRGSGKVSLALEALARPGLLRVLLRTLSVLNPDIILFIKCDQVPSSFYSRLRRNLSAAIFAFHPDDPFSVGGRRALEQMRAVDSYFVWSRRLVERARGEGARAHYLPFASDPELHYPVPLSDEERVTHGAEVSFVGNWDPERERWLRPLSQFRLAVWGNDYWGFRCRDPGIRAAWRGKPAVGTEMAKVVAGSAVNLNILRVQNKGASNMRTFEIPACGGFMLHERSEELPGLFRPGIECDDFGSERELVQKVRHYLEHPAERERLALRGQAAARTQSYGEWAKRVLEVFREMPPGRVTR